MAFSGMSSTRPSMSEINVTPLVDVVLVLLIIFMVTAPILQTGIEVNLPRTRTVANVDPEQRAVVTIGREETLYYGSSPLNFNELGNQLKTDIGTGNLPVFLQADEDVPWKTIVAVMDEIRVSGYTNIQVVTRPFKGKAP